MFVDPLTKNPSNSRTLQVLSLFQSFSPQPLTVSQPAGVNVSTDRQSVRTNVSMTQGQEISNNAELMLKSSAIPYNNNQLADLEL